MPAAPGWRCRTASSSPPRCCRRGCRARCPHRPAAGATLGEAVRRRLARLAERAGDGTPALAAIERAARELQALFDPVPLPVPAEQAVLAAGRALLAAAGGSRLAVRSSAPHEDGERFSFAGCHDTVLGVGTPEQLLQAVRTCLVSAFSARALAGRWRHRGPGAVAGGPAGEPPRMAVLVQVQVEAELAGILFTRDPTQDADRMVLELVEGSGEQVAAGSVHPARFGIDRRTGAVERLGGDPELEPPLGLLHALADLGRRLEALFGGPQDVEWAARGRAPVLLQTRPITAGAGGPPPPARQAAPGDLWTAANSQEALAGPVSPLTYSFMRPLIERGRIELFAALGVGEIAGESMRLFQSRVYFNTGYFRRFLERLPGVPVQIFDALLFGETAGGAALVFPRVRPSWRLVRLAALVARHWLGAQRRMDRYVPWLQARLRALVFPPAARLGDRALLRRLGRMAHVLERGLRLHVLGSALAGGHYLLLSWFLQQSGVEHGHGTADELLAAVPGVETSEAYDALVELALRAGRLPCGAPGGAAGPACRVAPAAGRPGGRCGVRRRVPALSGALRPPRGHRGRAGSAALARGPRVCGAGAAPLPAGARARRAAVAGGGAGSGASAAGAGGRRGARGARTPRRPLAAVRGGWSSGFCGAGRSATPPTARTCDFTRCGPTRGVRALVREIGARLAARGLLAAPDEVFFLTFEEALAALGQGPAPPPGTAEQLRATVAARRAEHERAAAQQAPKFIWDDGTPAPVPARLRHAGAHAAYLQGVGVSGGVVRGRVRRVETLHEALALRPGEILLARLAPPAWLPAFLLARGVILDVGGMLSHCAVLAREHGIPCVVGTRNATLWLRDGEEVTLDAYEGRVYVHR
ncbi:MAG: hypothetical protein KatS3mg102_0601 [Planctomycetota bacterium]|nr:MAG: hypothetical protein KatS3mg102_0601 [Planctomycetota bacterium]